MRTAFFAAKNYLSFKSHAALVKLQQKNLGSDIMGTKCANEKAAKAMTLAISEVYHKDLVQKMKDMTSPFSVIIDASTDRSQEHVLVVLFQYLTPEGKIQESFYKLVEIKLDESAEGQLLEFQKALEKDDLWDVARER